MKPVYWILTALYCAMIFALSSRPHVPTVGVSIPHLDKLAHAVLYAGLTAVVSVGLWRSRDGVMPRWAYVLPVAFAVFYGITDEVHQLFVPNRTFDLFDLLADAVGATLMQLALYRFWWRRRQSA